MVLTCSTRSNQCQLLGIETHSGLCQGPNPPTKDPDPQPGRGFCSSPVKMELAGAVPLLQAIHVEMLGTQFLSSSTNGQRGPKCEHKWCGKLRNGNKRVLRMVGSSVPAVRLCLSSVVAQIMYSHSVVTSHAESILNVQSASCSHCRLCV